MRLTAILALVMSVAIMAGCVPTGLADAMATRPQTEVRTFPLPAPQTTVTDVQRQWEAVMCPVLATMAEIRAERRYAVDTVAGGADWTTAEGLGRYDELLAEWDYAVKRIAGTQLYPEAPPLQWQAAVDLNLAFIRANGALSMERLGSEFGSPTGTLDDLEAAYIDLVDIEAVCADMAPSTPTPASTVGEAGRDFEEFGTYINRESDEMGALIDAIFLEEDRVDPDAMVTLDDYVEQRIAWLDSHPPADCYLEAWDAHRQGAEHLHDWIMYFAARVQQANPDLGTRHIVSMRAEDLDQLIPEALEGYASEMQRVAEFSERADRPCS